MTQSYYSIIEKEKSSACNLNFPAGRLNKHNDTFIEISKSHKKEFDFLCFFDSRGSTLYDDKTETFSGLLIDCFRSLNKSFILICRP